MDSNRREGELSQTLRNRAGRPRRGHRPRAGSYTPMSVIMRAGGRPPRVKCSSPHIGSSCGRPPRAGNIVLKTNGFDTGSQPASPACWLRAALWGRVNPATPECGRHRQNAPREPCSWPRFASGSTAHAVTAVTPAFKPVGLCARCAQSAVRIWNAGGWSTLQIMQDIVSRPKAARHLDPYIAHHEATHRILLPRCLA